MWQTHYVTNLIGHISYVSLTSLLINLLGYLWEDYSYCAISCLCDLHPLTLIQMKDIPMFCFPCAYCLHNIQPLSQPCMPSWCFRVGFSYEGWCCCAISCLCDSDSFTPIQMKGIPMFCFPFCTIMYAAIVAALYAILVFYKEGRRRRHFLMKDF